MSWLSCFHDTVLIWCYLLFSTEAHAVAPAAEGCITHRSHHSSPARSKIYGSSEVRFLTCWLPAAFRLPLRRAACTTLSA